MRPIYIIATLLVVSSCATQQDYYCNRLSSKNTSGHQRCLAEYAKCEALAVKRYPDSLKDPGRWKRNPNSTQINRSSKSDLFLSSLFGAEDDIWDQDTSKNMGIDLQRQEDTERCVNATKQNWSHS